MTSPRDFIYSHRHVATLLGSILILAALPVLDIFLVLGNAWQGVPPTFTDETFYLARVQTVVEGHAGGGHPYFLEHSNEPSLVFFAGTWIHAVPQLLGLPMNAALMFNFIVWSLVFAAVLYWLLKELRVPPWIAVCVTVFLYMQSYSHVWRPVNLQPVYPVYFLFYLALIRFIRERSRRNIILLTLVTGVTFYFFSYLWQTVVITLGLLTLYALVRRNWPLLKATLFSSLIGGAIGLPVLLYALWLSRTSPYFWESVGRLGLVNTHLPMAEVIYSGGWVGVILVLLGILYWRGRTLRKDTEFILLGSFVSISGLGLWIMQGSNLFTGKLLETGEKLRLLIMPWLVFSITAIGVLLWERRARLSQGLRVLAVAVIILVSGVSMYFAWQRFPAFLPAYIDSPAWRTTQLYMKPLAWLEQNEKDPVVVWSNPRNRLADFLPILTKHFSLYVYFGMLELMPEDEVRERYLVSQYFNNLTVEDLRSEKGMELYLGRHDFPHQAKTIERGIKICQILLFWDKNKNCGTPPTPQELLGGAFFADLESRFKTDIVPNIKAYLEKYHVSYILKDKVLDPQYHPEALGAIRVYADDRYEIYHL